MKSFNFVIAVIGSVLIAVACGLILWYEYEILALACYAAIILALPVCILLHELGHVFCGAIVKIKAVPQFSFLGSSGCKIIPKTDKKLRGKLYFTAAGGIFVNLLFLILGLVAMYVKAVPAWLCVFAPASAYLIILNALPDVLPNGKTDGLIMQELLKNADAAKVTVAVLTVQAQILKGKPIEEVDEGLLFKLPVIQEDDPAFISLTELRYEYFKAKGDEEQAEKYKQRLESLKEYM